MKKEMQSFNKLLAIMIFSLTIGVNSLYAGSFVVSIGKVAQNITKTRSNAALRELRKKSDLLGGLYSKSYGGRYPSAVVGVKVGLIPIAAATVGAIEGAGVLAQRLSKMFANDAKDKVSAWKDVLKLVKEYPVTANILAWGSLGAAGVGAYIYNEYSKNAAKFAEDAKAAYIAMVKGNALATVNREGLDAFKRAFELYKSAYNKNQINELEALFVARATQLEVQAQAEARVLPDAFGAMSARLDRMINEINNLVDATQLLGQTLQ